MWCSRVAAACWLASSSPRRTIRDCHASMRPGVGSFLVGFFLLPGFHPSRRLMIAACVTSRPAACATRSWRAALCKGRPGESRSASRAVTITSCRDVGWTSPRWPTKRQPPRSIPLIGRVTISARLRFIAASPAQRPRASCTISSSCRSPCDPKGSRPLCLTDSIQAVAAPASANSACSNSSVSVRICRFSSKSEKVAGVACSSVRHVSMPSVSSR